MADTGNELAALIDKLRTSTGFKRPFVATRIEQYGRRAIEPLMTLLNDSEWVMRFWAARLLGKLGDDAVVSALEQRRSLEDNDTVARTLRESINALKPVPDQDVPPISNDPAELQRNIDGMLKGLIEAYRRSQAQEARTLRQKLINEQIHLCEALRGNSLSAAELASLTDYYTNRSTREALLGSKPKWCWVCKAPLDTISNSYCQCGWLICRCGACQCPDFSRGPRGHQSECDLQIERLGGDQYQAMLVERGERQALRFQFARVDFSG